MTPLLGDPAPTLHSTLDVTTRRLDQHRLPGRRPPARPRGGAVARPGEGLALDDRARVAVVRAVRRGDHGRIPPPVRAPDLQGAPRPAALLPPVRRRSRAELG